MQYHAKSFADENFKVTMVGFHGVPPIESLQNNSNVTFVYLSPPPCKPAFMPGFVYYIFKAVLQWLQVFVTLLVRVDKCQQFLVQNPPAIPTLSVVWVVALLKGSQFYIDWHNYAYTILSLNLPKDHFLVRFSKWYEGVFGQLAHRHFCVTEAMKNDLFSKWDVKAEVLYDRPPERFKETTLEEKHKLFNKLSKEYPVFAGKQGRDGDKNSTTFTEYNTDDNVAIALERRPALVVSSTSWTEDEDFSILLDALTKYELSRSEDNTLPDIVCVITGKGPQKAYYLELIAKMDFSHVRVVTPWLESEDYPLVIGSADLGICLHTSSSGLDLPMKVVDMFGCGVPVCAVHFSCLHELVKHQVNGTVFQTPQQLHEQMVELLTDFPHGCRKLRTYRENLSSFQANRWHTNWSNVVLPTVS